MEFLKNITIFEKSLLDCFDDKGYKNEVIGVYNPNTLKLFEVLKEYQELGFRFLIYSNKDSSINKDYNFKVETDFRKFYKKIDMFIINSMSDYHLLINDLAGMQERVFIFGD